MKLIDFYKFSGSGNDFIIIDNRDKIIPEKNISKFVVGICRRGMSVGADGLILIEKSGKADFKWQFFNSDGSIAEMCGNGARCAARFACLNEITGTKMSFETLAGTVHAKVNKDRVKVSMPNPGPLNLDLKLDVSGDSMTVSFINTGVPHVVQTVDHIDSLDIVGLGRKIRHHEQFAPQGTNANFIFLDGKNTIKIRTYERGVEDETLACGTGSIAGAIVAARKHNLESPVNVITRSGEILKIYFEIKKDKFFNIYLEGDARVIYRGKLWEEAWR